MRTPIIFAAVLSLSAAFDCSAYGNDSNVESIKVSGLKTGNARWTYEKPLVMSLTWGPAINLGDRDNEWVGPIPKSNNYLNMRIEWYFLNHWGAYAGLHIGTHDPKNNWDRLLNDKFEQEYDACGLGYVISLNPGIGIAYQTSFSRLFLQARLGYGNYYNPEVPKTNMYNNYKEEKPTSYIIIDRNIWTRTINSGITLGYGISRALNFVIEVDYRVPLNRSVTNVGVFENDELVEESRYYCKSWGHNISFSFGFQFIGSCTKKRKQ